VEGILAMSTKERERLRVVQAVREGRLTQRQAAVELGLSVRQVKRLCRAFRRRGAGGLVSRRRGRPSNRRIAPAEQRRVVRLVQRHYPDFGPTLAAEYLSEHHGYTGSVETLRQWMIGAELWQPRRTRQRRVHQLRERRAAVGELVQIDGSPHAWLEHRAARCCLIAFVDDASGRLQYARFVAVESTRAYLQALHSYVQQWGRPVAFYSDRHSIFTKHDPEDPHPTQFERAVRALDIEPILALSPQAKGRVERAFQTLQDRLVKALRLARIDSLEAANAFLPGFLVRYNARFARTPREPADAHRRLNLSVEQLHWTCSEQFPRTLSPSLSCQFRGQLYLINTEGAPAYHLRRARITVCDHGPGQPLTLLHKGKVLPWRRFEGPGSLPERVADDKQLDQFVDAAKKRQARKSSAHKPDPNHPWLGKFRRPANKPTHIQSP
jgi:transposase